MTRLDVGARDVRARFRGGQRNGTIVLCGTLCSPGTLVEGCSGLAQVEQRRLVGVGPVNHRSELEHRERRAVTADPALPEQDRPRRVELDQQGHREPERRQDDQEQDRPDQIERALGGSRGEALSALVAFTCGGEFAQRALRR